MLILKGVTNYFFERGLTSFPQPPAVGPTAAAPRFVQRGREGGGFRIPPRSPKARDRGTPAVTNSCIEKGVTAEVRYTPAMIRQIAPVFFTMDIPRTLAYYKDKLGFECLGTWQDPPEYAIVARDEHAIHFRCAEPPTPNPDKYADELLDAYLQVKDADALFAEYSAKGVEFSRELGDTPWGSRGFAVKDCDGRLLAFEANV